MIPLYIVGILLLLLFLYALFMTVCALLVDSEREYDTNSSFYRFLLESATAAAMKILRIRIHASGLEKLPQDKKVLFVCNHRSNFDPLVTWHVLRKWKLAFISKHSNFSIPVFGRIIRRCCFLPIDRKDPRKAIITVNKAARLLSAQEVSVGIYPEGTRSKSGTLLPFHKGVFKIAQKAAAPIAVLSITGTQNIHKRTPLRRTDVYLNVLDVFPVQEVKSESTEAISSAARSLIQAQIEKEDNLCQKDM